MNAEHLPPLRVMLLKDATHRLPWVTKSLREAGCEVVPFSGSLLELEAAILREEPDVIMIETDSPSRDTLEHVCIYCQVCPRPIVLFTDDDDTDKLRQAVRAGVSAYVVAGLSAERVRPILEAAIARFQVQRELAEELNKTRATLEDRSLIDRAKRHLIKQGLSEEAAYHAIRRAAMEQRLSMAEAARVLLHTKG
jgi:two-component system, response regulator / RNA-binding antiterminator